MFWLSTSQDPHHEPNINSVLQTAACCTPVAFCLTINNFWILVVAQQSHYYPTLRASSNQKTKQKKPVKTSEITSLSPAQTLQASQLTMTDCSFPAMQPWFGGHWWFNSFLTKMTLWGAGYDREKQLKASSFQWQWHILPHHITTYVVYDKSNIVFAFLLGRFRKVLSHQ